MLEVNLRSSEIYQYTRNFHDSNFMINDILTDILQSSDFKQYGYHLSWFKKTLWPYMNV